MDLLNRLAASPDLMKEFQRERLATEITELISRLMEEQGMSRADLAKRLGVSRARVTMMLRHGTNLTVNTIADIFTALNRTVRAVDRPLAVSNPPLLVMESTNSLAATTSAPLKTAGFFVGQFDADAGESVISSATGFSFGSPQRIGDSTSGATSAKNQPRNPDGAAA